jgi:4-hydroxyphenylpyruvate dioxygenase
MPRPDIPLKRIDHLRFVVGNARQSAYFYRNAFGFQVVAYAGLETRRKDAAGYVLRQGDITFVLSSPLSPDHPDNSRLASHGDGVESIALEVESVPEAFETAVSRGATPLLEPTETTDAHGVYRFASIRTYGDTSHVFVDRSDYHGVFAPGFEPIEPGRYQAASFRPVGLKEIDHVVANVEEGQMQTWVDYYARVLGFGLLASFDDKDISTEYSALMSRVVSDGEGRIKFPINEPAKSRRKSQIDEYLKFYDGPGVQHIALATDDILTTVRAMAANDVSFLRVPPAYYDAVPERVGRIDESLRDLAELGILVDRDDEGYLLQIFTKPVSDRPTVFFEVIQRHGARSFGKGNFKALFEAIEREQVKRGTL